MIAAAFLLTAQAAPPAVQVAPVAPTLSPTAPSLPADWSQLPVPRWKVAPAYDSEMARFVVEEFKAGRCVGAQQDGSESRVQVDLALLIGPAGRVRTIIPRAIGCPTVEQYTAGLISRVARDNVQPSEGDAAWYRASVTFAWSQ